MPIKQAVLDGCPKIADGTINAFGFRMLDPEDYAVLSLLSKKDENGAAGCIIRCCNGRYCSCKHFQKWAKKHGHTELLKRDPSTMERGNSHIEGEE